MPSDAAPIGELILRELGRATAECIRLKARLAAIDRAPASPHTVTEREDLVVLLASTEERRARLEALAATLPR